MTAMKQEQQPAPGARATQAQPADQVRVGLSGLRLSLQGGVAPVSSPTPPSPSRSAPTLASLHPPSALLPGSLASSMDPAGT